MISVPTFIAVGLVEVALLATSSRVPLDETERARRSFSRALGGFALTLPFFFWEFLAAIMLAIIALRTARADIWRFAVPFALAAAAFVSLAVLQPTLPDLERGNFVEWIPLPAGVLLLAYVGWLAAIVHRARIAAAAPGR